MTLVLLTVIAGLAATTSRHPYRREWRDHVASRRSAVRAAVSATVGQIRNAPHEWGRGAAGFGKRFGSAVGAQAVKGTVEFGVAAARHEDLRYHPSRDKKFGPRLRHALVSTVVTRKTTTGKRTAAVGRVSGNVTSAFVSRAWQPARLHTFGSGATTAGIGLGAEAGANVVQEFWPEIRHPKSPAARREARLRRRHG